MNIRKNSYSPVKLNTSFSKGLFFLALISISNYCYSGIYKWVDEQGNTQYGQYRPSNIPAEQMDVQSYAPQDTSSYKRPGSNVDDKEQAAKDKAADSEPEKKVETKAEKKQRMAACAQARKNLTTMQSIGRIRSKDKDGNASFISQKQKEAKMQQSRDLISKHCK
mgnify:CR=1 FL=1